MLPHIKHYYCKHNRKDHNMFINAEPGTSLVFPQHTAEKQGCAIYAAVLNAMQAAEDLGGPEGEAYVWLMERIAAEALGRAEVCRATR